MYLVIVDVRNAYSYSANLSVSKFDDEVGLRQTYRNDRQSERECVSR